MARTEQMVQSYADGGLIANFDFVLGGALLVRPNPKVSFRQGGLVPPDIVDQTCADVCCLMSHFAL